MKQYLLLFMPLFVFITLTATAQKSKDDSTYVSHNGTTFKVGQTLTLGLGTRDNGEFKYIVSINILDLPNIESHLKANFSTQKVTITRIKRFQPNWMKKDADPTIYLVFKYGIEKYGINIESALLAKEVQAN
jgi:hypothetical protein